MKLAKDMTGEGVPIITIFNPGSPRNKCVKDPSEFQALASQHGVAISEVIHFDKFDLKDFLARYTVDYQVMVPAELHKLLEARDVTKLATRLKEIRRTKCQSLPHELNNLRNSMTALRGQIKEYPQANCQMRHCTLDDPEMKDCLRQVCSSEKRDCWRSGLFGLDKNCIKVCAKYTTVTDQECAKGNSDRRAAAERAHAACIANARKQHEGCLKDHEACERRSRRAIWSCRSRSKSFPNQRKTTWRS
ncbi:unnamed protein product [Symbiodinium natans]|uniref:Uncharacterized protein n=1 Tax=Symbiodinium natans TaxID=878477 RepID=A0A812RQ62_9DINO|nr:unnamed protein product [Symbiodinium natans]